MTEIDAIRSTALARIERAERHYKLAFLGALAVEGAFLAAFLLLADLENRTHLLLLVSTVATYTIVAFACLALGAHVNRTNLRLLRAIEAQPSSRV